jgi:hypothetical protein
LDLDQVSDQKSDRGSKTAYLPAYTCETVIAPYKKAGYTLLFYDVSPALCPRFDWELIPHISVLGLCGYYGFSSYDRDFVGACAEAGVKVVQDFTHSIFSADGIETRADYVAGSLRKWMGIPSGGIAVKRQGTFSLPLLPLEEEHLRGRLACFQEQERVSRGEEGASEKRAGDIFWETEMRLRRIFDAYESDALSRSIIEDCPWRELVRKRQENYRYILDRNPFSLDPGLQGQAVKAVFPVLTPGVCPSHLALYSPDREGAREILASRGIKSTVYWPFHGELDLASFPGAAYIYDHIYTVPIDQRYGKEDIDLICQAIEAVRGNETP